MFAMNWRIMAASLCQDSHSLNTPPGGPYSVGKSQGGKKGIEAGVGAQDQAACDVAYSVLWALIALTRV